MASGSQLRFAAIAALVAGCTALTGAGDLEATLDPSADGGTLPDRVTPSIVDAATDAARPVDADAGPAPCPPFAVFCDDFEDPSFAKWTLLFLANGGTVTSITTPVRSGGRAMKAHAGPSTPVDASYPAVGAGARVTVPAVSSGMLAVRAHVLMPAKLYAETTFVKVFAKNGVDDMNLKIAASGAIKVDSDTPRAGAELTGTKGPPIGSWFCVEWQATIAASGRQRVLVDGEVVLDAGEDNTTADGFDRVQVGFHASNGAIAQDVIFDDVAIATQPIGCP